jgi:ABC-type transporter Mla MlaB component
MPETTILIFADNMCHSQIFFFSFSAVPTIDTSGIAFLIDLKKATEKHGLEVYSSYISQAVNLVM